MLTLFSFSALTGDKVDMKKKWTAVHDFNMSEPLVKLGLNGWWIAEKMESELAATGRCKVVTRARIAKVMKEKNIGSSASLQPAAFGKMIGSDYIVTGQVEFSNKKVIVNASLIDAKNEAGAVLKSFNASAYAEAPAMAAIKISDLIKTVAGRMVMTPGEFLDEGLSALKENDFSQAAMFFQCMDQLAPMKKLGDLSKQIEAKGLKSRAMSFTPPGHKGSTPGALFDWAVEQLDAGNENAAGMVMYRLEQSLPIKKIDQLLATAREEKARKRQELKKLYDVAEAKYRKAALAPSNSAAGLCDEAAAAMRLYLSKAGSSISTVEQERIRKLIEDIEKYRARLFAGPARKRDWTIPGIDLKMSPVEPGKYRSVTEDAEYDVSISKNFWIGKYEVTVAQFRQFLKEVDSWSRDQRFKVEGGIVYQDPGCPLTKSGRVKAGFTDNHPVSGISWYAAREFCRWLNKREEQAKRLPEGYEYRLPTEAEWEYACRTGTNKDFSFTGGIATVDDYAVYRDNSKRKSQRVGSKKANNWNIYDMHGNVWEWCNDWYGERLSTNISDPVGPSDSDSSEKVLKGGSYVSSTDDLRAGARYSCKWKNSKKNIGFRVVCAPII